MTLRVVFLDRASLSARVRKPACAADYVEYEKTAVDEIVPRLTGATVAVRLRCGRMFWRNSRS